MSDARQRTIRTRSASCGPQSRSSGSPETHCGLPSWPYPPVISKIRDEFGLSATQVGLLSSIPPALFAIAALVGSLLVARAGLKAALLVGLLMMTAGSALRGLSASYAVLFATTVVMSAGVALMQPMMPTAVRQWVPRRIGLGTAVYTNGLLVGEILPVLLTIPLVLPLVNASWRASLAIWPLPILIIAVFVWLYAPSQKGWRPSWQRRASQVAARLERWAGLAARWVVPTSPARDVRT